MEDEWAEITRDEVALSRTSNHGLGSRPLSEASDRHSASSTPTPAPAPEPTPTSAPEKDMRNVKSLTPLEPVLAAHKPPTTGKPLAPKAHGSIRKEASIEEATAEKRKEPSLEETAAVEKPRVKRRTLGSVQNQSSSGTQTAAPTAAGAKGDVSINIMASKEKEVRSQTRKSIGAKPTSRENVEKSIEKTELKISFAKEASKTPSGGEQSAPTKASNGTSTQAAEATLHSSQQTLIIQNRAASSQIVVRNTVTESRSSSVSKCGCPSTELPVVRGGSKSVESPIRKVDATRPILSEPLGPGLYGPADLLMGAPVCQSVPVSDPLKATASKAIALEPGRPPAVSGPTTNSSGSNPVSKVGAAHSHGHRPSALPVKMADNVCGRYGAIICTIL